MADAKKVTVIYKPPKGELWKREVTEEVAAKMVKLGRWKYEKSPSSK